MKNVKSTIYDVASRAGVSTMTVTRVLKYPSLVAPDTLARVQSVIGELDYSPNVAAQSLTTSRTRQICFILSSDTTLGLANSYYSTEMAGVISACAEHDYQCVVNVYDFSNLQDFVLPGEIRRRGIDGIIAAGYVDNGVLAKLGESDIPIIFLGEPREPVNFPVVTADTLGTLKNSISYLAKKGHIRIGFALSSHRDDINRICADFGVDATYFQVDEFCSDSFEIGCSDAESWMRIPSDERPTAIYGNDQWAVAFISTIQERGLSCPRDVSVISGDTTLCQWSSPKITSFGIDAYGAGFKTAALLIDSLEASCSNDELIRRASEIDIPGELVERASVRRI